MLSALRKYLNILLSICLLRETLQQGTDECYEKFHNASDIVFLFDNTGSISASEYRASISTIKELIQRTIFIGAAGNASKISLITFGKEYKSYFDSITSKSNAPECEIIAKKSGVLYQMDQEGDELHGSENQVDDVLDRALEVFDSSTTSQPILFLIMDGHEVPLTVISKLEDAKIRRKFEIFGIGIGTYLNETVMAKLVSSPSDCYYASRSNWEDRIINQIPYKLTSEVLQNEKTKTITDPNLCGLSCPSCTCQEYSRDELRCSTQQGSTTPTTITSPSPMNGGPTREPPNPSPSINNPCETGPEGRECGTIKPTPSTPHAGRETNEVKLWTVIIVFAVLHFAFFSMWCMFVWLWCCGFLDKQLGTTPAPDMRKIKRRPPEGSPSDADPPKDPPHRAPPSPELYGNTIVGEVLNANKDISLNMVSDGGSSISPFGRRPQPPEPVSPGTFSNPAYQVTGEAGRSSYTQIEEISEDEDDYVNVTDRVRGKVREIKSRVSGVFHMNYENEHEIERIRANHEKKNKNRLKPSRTAPPPPKKKDVDKLFRNSGLINALKRKMGAKNLETSSSSMPRQDSQHSAHSYLDLQ